MDLKQRKELKSLMGRIANSAAVIKRDAHEFRLNEDSHLQMYSITMLVEKAKMLMETLKPQQPNGDDAIQGVLLDLESEELVTGRVIITPNGAEPPSEEVEENLSV